MILGIKLENGNIQYDFVLSQLMDIRRNREGRS